MGKIIACIDGSSYADGVCELSSWVAKNSNTSIALLHVALPHSELAPKADFSGSIGLGAKSDLLKELSDIDEAHGKNEQKKGQLMLKHANDELESKGVMNPEILHLRGSFAEVVSELDTVADVIIMGKRGEETDNQLNKLGGNLERIIKSTNKPVLVTTNDPKIMERFLIAYDDSPSSQKALEYVVSNPLLKGLECHLIKVCEESGKAEENLKKAEIKLTKAGFNVIASLKKGGTVKNIITDYINNNKIDLLVMGAYGHSKIKEMLLGSTTNAILRDVNVSVLMFR